MSRRPRRSRLPTRLYFALMTALVVVLGHTLALAIGEARSGEVIPSLTAARHGEAWVLAVAVVVIAVLGFAVAVAWRMQTLRRRLLALACSLPRPRRPQALELLRTWGNLFLVSVAVFVVQENAEHLVAHGHLPGLPVLVDGHYAVAIPAFAVASLVVAAIWTICQQRLAAMTDAIAAVDYWLRRAPRTIARPVDHAPDRRAADRQRSGLAARRAPPWSVPA
ncbi:MAG: hypothetical protein WED86_02890 [Chloroflexota bacterium]